MHRLEKTVPFFKSFHGLTGRGFLNLSSLTGGSAYGIAFQDSFPASFLLKNIADFLF
jgi:hypothetical protein